MIKFNQHPTKHSFVRSDYENMMVGATAGSIRKILFGGCMHRMRRDSWGALEDEEEEEVGKE